MKKRILTIVAGLMMAITPSMAQVFLDDDDYNNSRAQYNGELGAIVPPQNDLHDQYVPVGESLVLLTGLGVAYLLGKRKKNE